MSDFFGVSLKPLLFKRIVVLLGKLGLHKLARSDEGPKALFVGECVGRTSRARTFRFNLDWGWQ